MTTTDRIRELIEPLVADLGLELFDLEFGSGQLKVTVDRSGGVDMQAVADATRAISRALDDADPIAGRYTLEVSSPGLERPLRTPRHFAWAVGQQVAIKTVPTYSGERRLAGTIIAADASGVVVRSDEAEHRVSYADIERARTVFRWEAEPKSRSGSNRPRRGTTQPATRDTKKKDTKRAKAS
jgi:ribosome maturation factor RimP